MDAIQILINVANQLEASGIQLVIALAFSAGLSGCVLTIFGQTRLARAGRPASGHKVLLAVCMGGALIALEQMMNAASHTLGFGDVSFDSIAYAPTSLGEAALAINAVLTLLRWVGVVFFFMGLSRARRALVDGHTGLSSREDVGTGVTQGIVGILLTCNPEFLDALQKTFQLSW